MLLEVGVDLKLQVKGEHPGSVQLQRTLPGSDRAGTGYLLDLKTTERGCCCGGERQKIVVAHIENSPVRVLSGPLQ